jgi:hypothetical protein
MPLQRLKQLQPQREFHTSDLPNLMAPKIPVSQVVVHTDPPDLDQDLHPLAAMPSVTTSTRIEMSDEVIDRHLVVNTASVRFPQDRETEAQPVLSLLPMVVVDTRHENDHQPGAATTMSNPSQSSPTWSA